MTGLCLRTPEKAVHIDRILEDIKEKSNSNKAAAETLLKEQWSV
jgi:hypothetical protein